LISLILKLSCLSLSLSLCSPSLFPDPPTPATALQPVTSSPPIQLLPLKNPTQIGSSVSPTRLQEGWFILFVKLEGYEIHQFNHSLAVIWAFRMCLNIPDPDSSHAIVGWASKKFATAIFSYMSRVEGVDSWVSKLHRLYRRRKIYFFTRDGRICVQLGCYNNRGRYNNLARILVRTDFNFVILDL
ncbi:hypothetical protein CFOL_v3_03099, partial [Cephalotus follicularis]